MTLRAISVMFAIALGVCACTSTNAFADLVKPGDSTEATAENSSEVTSSLIAIPEPATFGIVSVGIAICGGLLVRNKRSDA